MIFPHPSPEPANGETQEVCHQMSLKRKKTWWIHLFARGMITWLPPAGFNSRHGKNNPFALLVRMIRDGFIVPSKGREVSLLRLELPGSRPRRRAARQVHGCSGRGLEWVGVKEGDAEERDWWQLTIGCCLWKAAARRKRKGWVKGPFDCWRWRYNAKLSYEVWKLGIGGYICIWHS